VSDTQPQVDDEVAPYVPEDAPHGYQGITDDSLASWAFRKLAAYQREVDRIRRNAQEQLDAIQAKARRDEKTAADKVAWFRSELVAYRLKLEAERPDLPGTYKLPFGDLTRRKGSLSVVVADKELAVPWVRQNAPEALGDSIKVSTFKGWPRTDDGEIIAPTGEPVPGVVEKRGPDTYGVTLTVAGAEADEADYRASVIEDEWDGQD
jgi:hypothetical protein